MYLLPFINYCTFHQKYKSFKAMKYKLFFNVLMLLFSMFFSANVQAQTTKSNTMKIEIWSDVMCPFCYIGKRKIEKAIHQFNDKQFIEIEWKSFQLSPNMVTDPSINVTEYLAKHKGISVAEAQQMNNYVTQMAQKEGLEFNFSKAVVANSFDAHRFSHFAKTKGLQHEAEEALFKAYFTDGKNTADHETLLALAKEIGLNPNEVKAVLNSNQFASQVKEDINEAQKIGVRGVPFFVFDRKYAISGAQEQQVFEQTLQKAFDEWKKENPGALLKVTEGAVCKPDGSCD